MFQIGESEIKMGLGKKFIAAIDKNNLPILLL